MLTPDEIDLIDSGMCGEREFSHNYAHAIIEAYERKNGIEAGRNVQEKQS